jgi:peptidylprolyl isomerase
VNFPTLEEARAFHARMTPAQWDEEKKKDAKFSTPTGHISLEAVIDLWQVPKDDAYRIHALAPGEIAAPAKMYKGWGVFRLIDKKEADPALFDEKKKAEYVKILTQIYYYNSSQKVIQEIITRAAMKDYERDKVVVLETSAGVIEVQLYTAVAPKACENFIGLAEKGYYDGTLFHRVIKGFMIQGGDPTGTGTGGRSLWGEPFADEVHDQVQFEKAGILAMANSGPGTNGSQFFITLAPTPHLNKKHTIFGEVITGFDVVRKIGETPVGEADRPLEDQKVLKMRLKKWL